MLLSFLYSQFYYLSAEYSEMADAECPQVAGPELFLSPLKVVFIQAKIVRYNFFAITRFRYIEVLFHIFYHYGFKQNRSFY